MHTADIRPLGICGERSPPECVCRIVYLTGTHSCLALISVPVSFSIQRMTGTLSYHIALAPTLLRLSAYNPQEASDYYHPPLSMVSLYSRWCVTFNDIFITLSIAQQRPQSLSRRGTQESSARTQSASYFLHLQLSTILISSSFIPHLLTHLECCLVQS